MSSPLLSILISIGPGREQQLSLSLQTLTKTSYDVDEVELVVFLDYYEIEETVKILQRYKKRFHTISCFALKKQKTEVSHSASRRNFLAIHARGEYILFMEPEMFHVGNTIPLAMNFINKRDNHSWFYGPVYATAKVVAKNGSFVINDNAKTENIPYLLSLTQKYAHNFFAKQMKRYFFKISEKKYPPLFFCTMIHRDFFFRIGALNQNLKVRGWEELEFFTRFQKQGGHLSFNKKFITCHLPHTRTLSLIDQVGWDLYNSTVAFDTHQHTGILQEEIRGIVI